MTARQPSQRLTAYVFSDAPDLAERMRLRMIEAVFDPGTRRLLEGVGIAAGWRCLEVGAGAGSIAGWMADRVMAAGQVTALDLDTKHVQDLNRSDLHIVQADVRDWDQAPETYDLVHARYVLIHQRDPVAAIQAMVRQVRPGGWIVLEEPDFRVARVLVGNEAERKAFAAVSEAIDQMFADGRMNHGFGAELPQLVAETGCRIHQIEHDAPASTGGEALARMMGQSAVHLRTKYLATRLVNETQLEHYEALTRDPAASAVYYATVRVVARRLG